MMQAQLARFPEAESVAIAQEIRQGRVSEEILKAQEEQDIDMIIVARHGKKSLLGRILPGVTEKIRKNARCSVLVVGS